MRNSRYFRNNTVSLIVYPDSFLSANSKTGNIEQLTVSLNLINNSFYGKLFSRTHILPFYEGERDGGFSIANHKHIRKSLGTVSKVKSLVKNLNLDGLTSDLVLNHLDRESPEFLDVIQKGRKSKYWHLFLKKEDIFFNEVDGQKVLREPSVQELSAIHRPRPSEPFTVYEVGEKDERIEFWTTFTSDQIDLNWNSSLAKKYMEETIDFLSDIGVNLIRLDAAYYPVKKAGTSCFGLPETFKLIDEMTDYIHSKGMLTLLEIHAEPDELERIQEKADYVYSFADPIVILDAIHNRRVQYLVKLLDIDLNSEKKGKNKIRVTATHDGIGPVTDGKGILPNSEIEKLKHILYAADSSGLSREASGDSNGNVDIYQVNSTFWNALECDSQKFLTAKAIQLFLPGIPQIYYVDLLIGENDPAFRVGEGRDINRHRFYKAEVEESIKNPVMKELVRLMKIRQNNEAFNGSFAYIADSPAKLSIKWNYCNKSVELIVDLERMDYSIAEREDHDSSGREFFVKSSA